MMGRGDEYPKALHTDRVVAFGSGDTLSRFQTCNAFVFEWEAPRLSLFKHGKQACHCRLKYAMDIERPRLYTVATQACGQQVIIFFRGCAEAGLWTIGHTDGSSLR